MLTLSWITAIGISSALSVIAAGVLAFTGRKGWPWFLLLALLLCGMGYGRGL